MSRYIDADALIKKYQEHHDFFLSAWGGDFKSMGVGDKARCDELTNCIATIVNAPSIELVRCKECKHNYNTAINHGKMNPRCNFTDMVLTENDYCSRGERQTESKLTASGNSLEIPTDTEDFTNKSMGKSKLKQTERGYMWTCPICGLEVHSDFTRCPCCGYAWQTERSGE